MPLLLSLQLCRPCGLVLLVLVFAAMLELMQLLLDASDAICNLMLLLPLLVLMQPAAGADAAGNDAAGADAA